MSISIDSRLSTPVGYLKIRDILPKRLIIDTEYVTHGYKILYHGDVQSKRILLSNGTSMTCGMTHSMYGYDYTKWGMINNIERGDVLQFDVSNKWEGGSSGVVCHFGDKEVYWSEDLARFLSAVPTATVSVPRYETTFRFANGQSATAFADNVKRLFCVAGSRVRGNSVTTYSKTLAKTCIELDSDVLFYQNPCDRHLPASIWSAPAPEAKVFLQQICEQYSYLTHIDKSNRSRRSICIDNLASKQVANEIQSALSACGVPGTTMSSRIPKTLCKRNNINHGMCYRVHIYGRHMETFLNNVGYASSGRTEEVRKFNTLNSMADNHVPDELIPGLSNLIVALSSVVTLPKEFRNAGASVHNMYKHSLNKLLSSLKDTVAAATPEYADLVSLASPHHIYLGVTEVKNIGFNTMATVTKI